MFGFLKSKKKEIFQITEELREEIQVYSEQVKPLSLYEQAFYISGINFSASLLYTLDSLADTFYDNIPKNSRKETIAKSSRLYALRLAYMYYHWKLNLSTSDGEYSISVAQTERQMREVSEAVQHTIEAFWEVSAQLKIKKEFSVLYSTYSDDNSNENRQITHREQRLIYAKNVALFKNRDLDISVYETPLNHTDLMNLPSIPASERHIFLEAQSTVFDSLIDVLKYR